MMYKRTAISIIHKYRSGVPVSRIARWAHLPKSQVISIIERHTARRSDTPTHLLDVPQITDRQALILAQACDYTATEWLDAVAAAAAVQRAIRIIGTSPDALDRRSAWQRSTRQA
jgi:hypothetical protein